MPLVENRVRYSFITQHVDSYPCFALVLVENNFATTYTQKKQPFAAGVLCLRRKWVNSCGFPTRAEKSLQAYSHHGILTLKEFYSYVKWMLYPWKKSPISIGSLWESKRYPINPILISWMYVFWSFRSFQRGTLIALVQRTAKLQAVKDGDLKKIFCHLTHSTPCAGCLDLIPQAIVLSSKFEEPQFCSHLIYRDPHFLFGEIWNFL